MTHQENNVSDKLIAGIIMNLVALEARHVMRDAALRDMDLAAEETVDHVYANTVANIVKRFPDEVQDAMRQMLSGEGLRNTIRVDLERHASAPWLR